MTRRALIIICPGTINRQGYLPGTLIDANNYEKYLYSQFGGDWYNSEMDTLTNPTKNEVKSKVQSIDSDYSFVVYSGHGGVGNQDNRMYVELNDGELFIGDLKTASKKQTLIIDSCRTVFAQILNETQLKAFSDRSYGSASLARKKFDDHLSMCEDGIITIYACGKGQAAGDDKEVGGIFSSSLIKAGRIWAQRPEYDPVLDLQAAFNEANKIMNAEFVTIQTPEFNAGRRHYHFPFAVR